MRKVKFARNYCCVTLTLCKDQTARDRQTHRQTGCTCLLPRSLKLQEHKPFLHAFMRYFLQVKLNMFEFCSDKRADKCIMTSTALKTFNFMPGYMTKQLNRS